MKEIMNRTDQDHKLSKEDQEKLKAIIALIESLDKRE